jgi:alkanesulfonate monooxygenase SsuD/methylene tetrahydromethanopterin reductase-like flavin-dependent oxidoreductase (luciferase family)
MRFGLLCSAQAGGEDLPSEAGRGFRDYLDFNVEAEELGFHSSFLVEHHFTGWNQVSSTLMLLTALAMGTTRLRLGTAVIALPWHNPVLLAEEAATLDLISGGRLDFGIGKGYRHSEFNGFQVPQEEAEARFEEAVEVITRSWTERSRFSHHGRFWHFEDIVVEPPPAQRPHPPLWMAAGSSVSIHRAAARGLNLLLDQYASTEQIGERIALTAPRARHTGAGSIRCTSRWRASSTWRAIGRTPTPPLPGWPNPPRARWASPARRDTPAARMSSPTPTRPAAPGARALRHPRGHPLQAGGIEPCGCRVRPALGVGR